MSQPKVTTQGYTYLFEFEKEQVSIYFDRLHDDSKATKGEITVRSLIPNIPHHIHHSRFDLTSTTQKKALIKQLDERWKPEGWDWGDLIEQCIISVLEHFRRGEPLQTLEINDNQVIQHPDYLIWPLIPKDEPTIIYADGGSFKTQAKGDKVLMSNGTWENIENVQIGDEVISPQIDGSCIYAKVIATHSRFEKSVYQIRQRTRQHKLLYTCAFNHDIPIIHRYYTHTKLLGRKLDTLDAEGLSEKHDKRSNWCSFTTTAVHYSRPNSVIDPYCLGAYLGDGSSWHNPKQRGLNLTTSESQILHEFKRAYGSDILKIYQKKGTSAKDCRFSLNGSFAIELRHVGLFGKNSGEKFIPTEALLSDINYRRELLAGLLDTDGTVGNLNNISYTTKSKQLAEDIANLVFSLGGYATIHPFTSWIKESNFKGNYFHISIAFKDSTIIPFRTKKCHRCQPRRIEPRHIAVEAVKTKPQMVYGFETDSPSKWYVTNNWMVTHNSQMAQVVAAILLTSWKNNDLGLVPLYDKPVPCLYLDWETNANTIKYTLLKLRKGLSLPAFNMHYRKCHQSFADDLAEIHRMVDQCKPELLIVDSIAAAVATDLNAADGAIRLLTRDIRQLNVTSLILAHRAKDEENRGPYGSVFFKNYSRSVWHLKKYQELGAARMQIALMCEKTNTSTMFKPMAFEIAFFDDGTTVERTDIFDVPELSANMPLIDRMVATLSHRTMDIKLLAEELQVKEAELSVLLSNRVDRFIRLNDGKWGVKTGRAVDNVY